MQSRARRRSNTSERKGARRSFLRCDVSSPPGRATVKTAGNWGRGNIAPKKLRLAPLRSDVFDRLLARDCIDIEDKYRRTGSGKCLGDGQPDAVGCAGNNGYFIFQPDMGHSFQVHKWLSNPSNRRAGDRRPAQIGDVHPIHGVAAECHIGRAAEENRITIPRKQRFLTAGAHSPDFIGRVTGHVEVSLDIKRQAVGKAPHRRKHKVRVSPPRRQLRVRSDRRNPYHFPPRTRGARRR